MVCSVLGAPAAILISLLMVPDPDERHTGGKFDEVEQIADSTMDAIVKGTGSGLELLLNIVAMLIVFVALVHLANAILGLLPDIFGAPLTLQRALGWVMAPVCWLMGIPWSQAVTAGGLMGIKTILNELVAYLQLAALPDGALDPRSRLIMLYAMCGFANFGSLGIMIAGLSTMCPEKRDEVVSLGLKSIVSGTLTTCLLGAIVGVLTLNVQFVPRMRCSAQRCTADPGSSRTPAGYSEPRRSRVCSASLRRCATPGKRAASMQPELAVDGADLGRLDQPGMRHGDRVQRALELLQPEVEEFVEHRKVRAEVVILPDIGL